MSEIKQFTESEAIKYYESGEWKNLTDVEKCLFQLYQDRLCMPFSEFQQAMIRVIQRPIFTHEFSSSNRENLNKEFTEAINQLTNGK